MLLLFTEPILQFPQGSKNRSTTCLLRMRTHFKVADVKSHMITKNVNSVTVKLLTTSLNATHVARRHRFPNICIPIERSRPYTSQTPKIINQVKLPALTGEILIFHKSTAVLTWLPTFHTQKGRSLCTWECFSVLHKIRLLLLIL